MKSSAWLVVMMSVCLVRAAIADPVEARTADGDDEAPAVEGQAVEARADDGGDGDDDDDDGEAEVPPHIVGPAVVELGHGVEIALPEGFLLFEREVARQFLRDGGNDPRGVLAIVEPAEGDWWLSIDFQDTGHVSDDDADELEPGPLLESYVQGTRIQNRQRAAKGLAELYIDGWSQPPRYQRADHVLTWGIAAHDSDGDDVVNHFVNVLGRESLVAIILIAGPDQLDAARAQAAPVVAGVRFQPGHRYDDFDPSTDRSAGYGLAALVVGGGAAAKAAKAGVLAKLLLVFKKVGVFLALGIAGLVKWLLGRRRQQ